MIELVVPGEPVAQGSKRPVGRGVGIESNRERLLPWRQAIANQASEAMAGREPFAGPVAVEASFHFRRPLAHFGTGRNADALKPSAPIVRASKPDLDKLLRAIFDGMAGIVYRDDGQVVDVYACKHYGAPSVRIRVWEV